MHTRPRPMAHAPLLIILTLCLYGQAGVGDSTPQQPLQTTMHAFFQALTSVFPWSLDAQQFQAPEHRQRIEAGLQALAQHAEHLDTHGQDVPQSFGFLRRSLARSAHDAAERYARGEYPQARFVIQSLTENCFACHSRLPNLQPFDLGKHFLAATNLASLSVPQQVKLEVATRQFDTAVNTCEALLRTPDIPVADMWLMGIFEDYLKLIIRVRNDFPRAITVLTHFLDRSDVPAVLRDQLQSWINALTELQSHGPVDDALSRARTLIEIGQRRNRFPADQQGFVHFVVASSLLHRWLITPPTDTRALAEAYYWLGIAEASISRTSGLSEAPFFLETAIRLEPTSPIASQAYDVLNIYILTKYTGSLGTRVPSEVQEHLDELRRLRGGS